MPVDSSLIELKVSVAKLEEHHRILNDKIEALLRKVDNIPDNKDFGHIEKRLDKLEEDIEDNQKEVEALYTMTNKWKGGLLVIMAAGSLIGWVASFAGNIGKFFHSGG